ncbi:MAG: DUF2147 domain-containing protein [Pseudopedobacter saltans]|uniref:DUF2147 domain-containing protein n=1 Tax=Pseudopedobacter saltans TaxID=151895 RepID=A0A2W5H8J6_9SPHI|nr:MAG: DUF2147 domain-containing protein [Pseudopedobacter saltans]
MKKFLKSFLITALLTTVTTLVMAQDVIEGDWLNEEKEGKIEIYKHSDGKYYGKLVWLKDPNRDGKPKTDVNNKDAKLKNQPLIGLNILKGFSKDGDIYSGGTIYDPKNGKTYSCKITAKDKNTLSIRGYIGVSLLGRTTVWTRTTK